MTDAACISLTNPTWARNLQRLAGPTDPVAFWRRASNRRLRLDPGSSFYFNTPYPTGHRIVGRARYTGRIETMAGARELFEVFGVGSGAESESQLIRLLVNQLKQAPGEPVECIVLDNLEWLEPLYFLRSDPYWSKGRCPYRLVDAFVVGADFDAALRRGTRRAG